MVKAAPVLWDKKVVENSETVKAIAINSGIANACTGKLGEEANEKFASIVGNALSVEKEKVLICSTGVIGKQLSTDPIEKGIDEACGGSRSGSIYGCRAYSLRTFRKACRDLDGRDKG